MPNIVAGVNITLTEQGEIVFNATGLWIQQLALLSIADYNIKTKNMPPAETHPTIAVAQAVPPLPPGLGPRRNGR